MLADAGSGRSCSAASGGGRSPAPPRLPHPAAPRPPRRAGCPAASQLERCSYPPRAKALAGAPSEAMAQHFSLAACDVVGFDLDHTLCRYNLPESAPVSGAGCPGLTVCSLHGGWGWSFLPAEAAASAAGSLQLPRLCAEHDHPPLGGAEVCISGSPSVPGTGFLSPCTSQV